MIVVILKVINCTCVYCIYTIMCDWANSRHYRLQYKQGSYLRLLQDFM